MNRFTRNALVVGMVCCCVVVTLGSVPAAAAGADQEVLQADHALVEAIKKGDKGAVGKLLDANFQWTDSVGKIQTKAQIVQNLPTPAPGYDTDVKVRTFGQLGVVEASGGKVHVLRVWGKRPAGWRMLTFHEVRLGEKSTLRSRMAYQGPCMNCGTIPYQPKTEAQEVVIKGELAVSKANKEHTPESPAWANYFADDWVVTDDTRSKPTTKADRREELNAEKQGGLISGSPQFKAWTMNEFGDAMAGESLMQWGADKFVRSSRVWVKRNGTWQMLLSYQTTVQDGGTAGAKAALVQ